jgi:exopolyphosphatase / guanosine-5'-triphosphate,3'-diphosphate pyrophosphatase
MKYAAIDIGTNAARLLVGEVMSKDQSFFIKKISYTRIPLRLGEDVFESGKVSKNKIDDFLKTMKAFKLISEIFDVQEVRAVSTSAMREATNADKIIDSIKEETGIKLEIISGDEEASLIFSNFFAMELDLSIPFVVIDVGGGSTELSVFENGEKIASKSFNVGTLRILKGKSDESVWENIHDWILKYVDLSSEHRIFGTGGNINKAHKMLGYSFEEPIGLVEMKELRDKLASLTIDERIDQFHMKPDRADVIVPALDIFSYILIEIGANSLMVPKVGLADGMIYEMYHRNNN